MKDRNKSVPAVYVILEKDKKILIARRCNTGYEDGSYHVPSGHMELGELPKEAIAREAKEEIGICLNHKDLELVHTLYRTKRDETGDRVDMFFKASKWSGEITNVEPHKCDDLQWVEYSQLPDNTIPYIRHVIDCIHRGIIYSELAADFLKNDQT